MTAQTRYRPKFSLRALCFTMTMIGMYLAGWKATYEYGLVAGTSQRVLMPFIIVEDAAPRFALGATLVMRQERKYFFWCFREQQRLFVRDVRQEFAEPSRIKQRQLMLKIAKSRRQRIDRSKRR